MCTLDFDAWFADYLRGKTEEGVRRLDEEEVARLLNEKIAVRFLIAWSLLESRLFDCDAKGNELSDYCQRLVNKEDFDPVPLCPIIKHFHSRYQCKKLLSNLMHEDRKPNRKLYIKLKTLLEKPLDKLSNCEKVFLIVVVAYRYRNNIFHGSKGVESWLQFEEQIDYCIQIMQSLITHATEREKSA